MPLQLDVHDLWTSLRAVELLARAQPPVPGQAEYVAAAVKLRAAIEGESGGPCVFSLTLPLEMTIPPTGKRRKAVSLRLAPSLNEYAAMMPWTLKLVRGVLDKLIEAAKAGWPRWDCGSARERSIVPVKRGKRTTKVLKLKVSGGRRRILEVVRHSSRQVDELAVDVLGGKLAVDRLTWAGVIAGDAVKHIVRRPRWVPAKPGQGRLEIIVYEIPGTPEIP